MNAEFLVYRMSIICQIGRPLVDSRELIHAANNVARSFPNNRKVKKMPMDTNLFLDIYTINRAYYN